MTRLSPPLAVAPTLARGDVLDDVLAVLRRYVSLPTARSILQLTRSRRGTTSTALDGAELRASLEGIERSLRLFMADPRQAKECMHALEQIASAQPPSSTGKARVIPVHTEDDIARARSEVRALAAESGFTLVGQTRLITAVSEVSRNIVQYAGSGQVELEPTSPPPAISVVAADRGPGIANLPQILAGNYRSRLGMGLGLRGVKQLADRFEIVTGEGGTTVRFSLWVK